MPVHRNKVPRLEQTFLCASKVPQTSQSHESILIRTTMFHLCALVGCFRMFNLEAERKHKHRGRTHSITQGTHCTAQETQSAEWVIQSAEWVIQSASQSTKSAHEVRVKG